MKHIDRTNLNEEIGKNTVLVKKSNRNQNPKEQISQPQNETNLTDRKFIKNNLSLIISLILGNVFINTGYATTTQMSYTGSQTLTPSGELDDNFNLLIGDTTDTKLGVVVKSGGIPVASDTELTIDYNTGSNPDFIVAGYTNNNVINFKSAKILGNVYAGLSMKSELSANSSVSNLKLVGSNNTISLSDGIIFDGDAYSGYMGAIVNTFGINDPNVSLNQNNYLNRNTIDINGNLIEIKSGNIAENINSGIGELRLNSGDATSKVISVYYYGNSNLINSVNNKIKIYGSGNNIKNIKSGSSLVDLIIGSRIQVDSDFQNSNYERTSLYSDNNILKTNYNAVEIYGNSNYFKNISTGFSEIEFNLGKSKNSSSIMENYSNLGVEINSDENKVNILGNLNNIENIYAGKSKYSFIFNDEQSFIVLNTQSYDSSEIIEIKSNGNKVKVDGDGNDLKDVYSGYSEFNFKTGNITTLNNNFSTPTTYLSLKIGSNLISSNNNVVKIMGSNNTGGIISGYSSINLDIKDIVAGTYLNSGAIKYGDAWLIVDVKNTQLSSNNNQINIFGEAKIGGNIVAGYNNFYLKHGNIVDGYGDDTDAPLIYMNGVFSSKYPSHINLLDINGTKAFANNNTITIDGEHTFIKSDIQDLKFPKDPTKNIIGGYGSIYGGYLNYNDKKYFVANSDGIASLKEDVFRPETYDVFTGNTLNYNNRMPITIKEIGNFQNYNFTIDSVTDNPTIPFITAEKIVLGNDISNMSNASSNKLNSNIHVKEIAGTKEIFNNTYYVLMRATTDSGRVGYGFENENHLIESVAQQGLSRVYDVDTYVYIEDPTIPRDPNLPNHIQNGDIVARIEGSPDDTGVETNPQLDALLLGNLSGLMLLTRNGDLLSDNLFNAISEQNYQRGLTPFIIASGNHTKYETGRHSNIKSDGALTTIGLSWQDEQTTLGAFTENGWDSYTTFNGFTDVANVSGKGHNRFNGFGLYGHYDFMNGWYADATLRGGRLHTAFETDDLRNVETDERAAYNLSTNYYGANLEGGYSIKFDPKNTVNLKAKYLWAQTDSQDLTIASEQIHFNKLDSHRIQFHIENLNQITPELTFISSLGYEHEFTGKAQGHASSHGFFEMDDQSVKGGTGISTLGLRYNPSQYKNLTLDVKATGYIGKREGGIGMLKVDYAF